MAESGRANFKHAKFKRILQVQFDSAIVYARFDFVIMEFAMAVNICFPKFT